MLVDRDLLRLQLIDAGKRGEWESGSKGEREAVLRE